jgi:hypothetical protein
MIFQSLRIDYFPGFSAIVRDKCDFVTVRLHGALDVRQLRLLLILRRILRFSLNEDRNTGLLPKVLRLLRIVSSCCPLRPEAAGYCEFKRAANLEAIG